MEEIKQMTTLQINLYIQRDNEPFYKKEIDNFLESKEK